MKTWAVAVRLGGRTIYARRRRNGAPALSLREVEYKSRARANALCADLKAQGREAYVTTRWYIEL
jgi:hypothetical protein